MKKSSRNQQISNTNAEGFWDLLYESRLQLEMAAFGADKFYPKLVPLIGEILGLINPFGLYYSVNIRRKRVMVTKWLEKDDPRLDLVQLYDGLLFASVYLLQLIGEMKRFKRSYIVDCGEEAFAKCFSDIKSAHLKTEEIRTILGRN